MNTKVIEKLYRIYGQEIYLYIYSICKDKTAAEDLTHDTFVKAILSLSEQHTNMRAWLYIVARNLCFNYMKKYSKEVNQSEEYFKEIEDTEASEKVMTDERNAELYEALAKLPPKKREILELRYFGRLSLKEIARLMNMTHENARVLCYRAKKELKEYMEVKNHDIP